MKRIKEFETEYLRISLVQEEGVAWYIREIGMTADNEHDTLTKFPTEKAAEQAYNRIKKTLQHCGSEIIKDTEAEEKRAPGFNNEITTFHGPETYKKIAEALPWEIQCGLLLLRDAGDDTGARENVFYKMPPVVYIAMLELCLITEWSETKRCGMELTTAGRHLVDFCTC